MLKYALTIGCLFCLINCNRVAERQPARRLSRLRIDALEDPKSLSIAVDAVKHLQESFNAGHCDLIYMEASEAFHELESRESWLATCARLQKDLGPRVHLSIESMDTGPVFVAHVSGTASFSNRSYKFQTVWILDNGKAKLFRLFLQGQLVVPEPHRDRWLTDPPQRR